MTQIINKEDKRQAIMDLKLAMQDEAYHRKKMEYSIENIKILKKFLNIK